MPSVCGESVDKANVRFGGQVLFAAEEHPQLLPLILRKFSSDGDVDTAQRLVHNSRGIERTRMLAASHAQLAMEAVREASCVVVTRQQAS